MRVPGAYDCSRRMSIKGNIKGNIDGNVAHSSRTALPACRSRKVTMSELAEPVVTLEFHEISSRARKLPAEASEFSAFLKKYIARWAGEAGAL
jgi:hypothetical protein